MEEIPKNLSQEDLVKYLNVIMVLLKKIQGDSKNDLGAVEVKLNQLRDEVLSALEQVKLKKGEKGDRGQEGSAGINGVDGKDGRNGLNGSNGVDGKKGADGYTPIAGVDYEIPENGIDGADGSPDIPEQVRDKLEELEDDERLPIEAIKDLREELDKLLQASSKISGGGGVGKHNVVAYDLSSKLNGVLKTFAMPSMWKLISITLSSFPGPLRPTTHYTVSGNSITFTSAVQADSALATDQTCIILYSE